MEKEFVKIVTILVTVILKMTLYLCIYLFTLYLQKTHYFKPISN